MLATVDDAGTPQPVLDRLNRELTQIVKSPGFAGRVEPLGFEARATTRDEFSRFMSTRLELPPSGGVPP
jgi:tripartite-type tricarboxylate transporter receptor subunit TctC